MIHSTKSQRKFFAYFFSLAIPIIIQNFMAASLNLIDNVMVGQLGDISIAGVGLGNQVYFVLQMFFVGISTGGSMFVAQFYGKKDRAGIMRVLGFTLIIAVSVSFAYFLAVIFMPARVIGFFTNETAIISAGSDYLGIVAWSYVITGFNISVGAILRSVRRVRQPMIANISGIAVNTLGNYLLIFGHVGLPALGVRGAAAATIMARIVEFAILLFFCLKGRKRLLHDIAAMFTFTTKFVKRFTSLASVLVLKDVIWGFGVTFYMAIYGRMGIGTVAAFNIMQAILHFATVLFSGYANACLIIVGNLLGAGRFLRAKRDVKRIIVTTILTAILTGAIVILARPLFLMPYAVSEAVKTIVNNLLFITGILMVLKVVNMVMIMGVLRGGGDVNFTLFMDITAVYMIGLPLGLIGWKIWHLNFYLVFILINLQEIYKLLIVSRRVKSMRWQRNIVNDLS